MNLVQEFWRLISQYIKRLNCRVGCILGGILAVTVAGIIYISNYSSGYVVTQYPGTTGIQSSFYTIKDSKGHLIVIDGGWKQDAEYVRNVISRNGNKVDAWIITHPHQDHAGAFIEILKDLQDISIQTIYDNGFDYDFIENVGEPYDDITIMEDYYKLTNCMQNVVHLRRGDSIDICGLSMKVINAYDEIVVDNIGTEGDFQNNGALLLMIAAEKNSMLFCSDIKYDMEKCLYADLEKIRCDYVQVAHHGNWGFSLETYLNLGARGYFFDAPSGIVDEESFPAYFLKRELLEKNKTIYDFSTGENRIVLE